MTSAIHPLAPHHLPRYLAGDGSDPLFTVVVVLLILVLLVVGNLYFKLHALPEQMAHKRNATQLQIVAVLALLALFTHNNVFWIAALLLAVVELPDYATPLRAMAASLDKIATQREAAAAPPAAEHTPASEAVPAAPATAPKREEC